jgi:hypothetical protein
MIMLGGRGERSDSMPSPAPQQRSSTGSGMSDLTDDALAGEDDLPF